MHVRDLGGHSGCKIVLCELPDENVFVRKISSSIDYNKRLEIQAEKQKKFKSEYIKTPEILNSGMTDDSLFYFDMEYIRGITLAEYMNTIEIGKVREFAELIANNAISTETKNSSDSVKIFSNKIQSLKNTLASVNNDIIKTALEVLDKHNWSMFAKTACHGDLTLENIIVKNDQLYFIDFLDSFYDSWLMDIGAILQDIQTMWAYRFQDEVNINTIIRLIVFRDILMDKIKPVLGTSLNEVYYALLLKLVRIYPYTNDEKTRLFLNNKILSVLSIIAH